MSPRPSRYWSLFVVVSVLAAPAMVLSGCATKDSKAATTPTDATKVDVPDSKFTTLPAGPEADLEVVDNEFNPIYATVTAGTKIVWKNDGRNKHNIIPTVKGAFAPTTNLAPGQVYSVTLDTPGDYPYYCSIHGTPKSGQNGVIRVVPAKG